MTDNLTKEQRSRMMSRIRSSKTTPELGLKKLLKALGFRYQPKGVYGRPDFANSREKIAVFIDGCFWHGCPRHYNNPKSNSAYWTAKIRRNKTRDREVDRRLKAEGWKIIRIWEHEVKRTRN